MDIRKWLIKKLAGDRLVVINSVMLYRYHPVFADTRLNPILEENIFVKHDKDTPFMLYDRKLFEIEDGGLNLKEEYKKAYENIAKETQEKITEQMQETVEVSEEKANGG